MPCCGTTYCEECITSHLVEHDFECPACESKVASLSRLRKDEDVRARVEEWKVDNERGGAAGDDVQAADGDGGGDHHAKGADAKEGADPAVGDGPDPHAQPAIAIPTGPSAERTSTADVQAESTDAVTANQAQDQEEDRQSEPEEGAASPTKPSGPNALTQKRAGADEQATAHGRSGEHGPSKEKDKSAAVAALDPAKMQEMLNPQVMQIYQSQVSRPSTFHRH